MNRTRLSILAVAALLVVLAVVPLAGTGHHQDGQLTLSPGSRYSIDCPTSFIEHAYTVAPGHWDVTCAALAAPTATNTPVPPTATPEPTATPTTPASGNSLEYGSWQPGPQDTCTAEQHNAYSVIGADGKRYSTWHPAVDPSGCTFGHEHGHDPATSAADNTLPTFGYAAEQMGMAEPHVGFKVFAINSGDQWEGKTAYGSYRIVLHMGTSGVGRYVQQFHSVEFDVTYPNGAYAHVTVMGDTGNGTGSTCTNPRDGGKDFSTVGCNDPYEIWNSVTVPVYRPGEIAGAMQQTFYGTFSLAVFDPITTRDPADNTRLLYSADYYQQGGFLGCKREAYGGPVYVHNTSGQSVFLTDPFGTVVAPGTAGAITQEVAAVTFNDLQIPKINRPSCDPSLRERSAN